MECEPQMESGGSVEGVVAQEGEEMDLDHPEPQEPRQSQVVELEPWKVELVLDLQGNLYVNCLKSSHYNQVFNLHSSLHINVPNGT